LWTRWVNTYGEETARAIASEHLKQAPLDVSLKDFHTKFEIGRQLVFDDVVRFADSGRIEDIEGFGEGSWWVQDIAATLPVRLLGDVTGRSVIDLCAAPGGKTAQLAARGARVTAVERGTDRIARLRENLARLNLEAEVIEGDARDWRPNEPAPFVLLDAPCSATGTIRRHPELPWIKGAADINQCANDAAELLDAAATMTAPGGTLVFAVCSLEPEEGPEQIAAFLEQHREFTRVPVRPEELAGHAEWIEDGDLRTLPFQLEGGLDGFYGARLAKARAPREPE
jgi:16S rRNA (cytosine967-C5)-methyltransferase